MSNSPPRITTTSTGDDPGGHVVDFDFQIEDIVATAAQAGTGASRRGSFLTGNGTTENGLVENKLRSRLGSSPTSPTMGTVLESPQERLLAIKKRDHDSIVFFAEIRL